MGDEGGEFLGGGEKRKREEKIAGLLFKKNRKMKNLKFSDAHIASFNKRGL